MHKDDDGSYGRDFALRMRFGDDRQCRCRRYPQNVDCRKTRKTDWRYRILKVLKIEKNTLVYLIYCIKDARDA